VIGSTAVDLVLIPQTAEAITSPRRRSNRDRKGKGKMEASYEVLGDSHSEETGSNSDEGDEDINGEGVRVAMEGFWLNQSARFVLAGAGFVMSIVGIWGDGA
jgi:autophagy-related protein 33